jgi:hypothetical protein
MGFYSVRITFWNRVRNYATLSVVIELITNLIFKKFAIQYRLEFLIYYILSFGVFLFSQIMLRVLKNKLK